MGGFVSGDEGFGFGVIYGDDKAGGASPSGSGSCL